jgi:hypothetical protein
MPSRRLICFFAREADRKTREAGLRGSIPLFADLFPLLKKVLPEWQYFLNDGGE